MATATHSAVVGVFSEREQAIKAIEDLRQAGFADDQISLATLGEPRNSGAPPDGPSGPPTFETGAAMGMFTGAALGGLVAGAPGMLAVGLVGALIGALIDLGIPETDARFFQDEIKVGRSVLITRTGGPVDRVADVLRRHGAREVRITSGRSPALGI